MEKIFKHSSTKGSDFVDYKLRALRAPSWLNLWLSAEHRLGPIRHPRSSILDRRSLLWLVLQALRLLVEIVKWLFRVWKRVAKAIDLEERCATRTVVFQVPA